jgi:hypothetical protein
MLNICYHSNQKALISKAKEWKMKLLHFLSIVGAVLVFSGWALLLAAEPMNMNSTVLDYYIQPSEMTKAQEMCQQSQKGDLQGLRVILGTVISYEAVCANGTLLNWQKK